MNEGLKLLVAALLFDRLLLFAQIGEVNNFYRLSAIDELAKD
jgi:hypothetical protein